MIYTVYIEDATGVPKTGLTPDWEYLYALDGTDKSGSAPAISEIGGGDYSFTVTYGTAPFDVDELVGVVDGGVAAGALNRYVPVTITVRDIGKLRQANKSTYDRGAKVETVYADDGTTAEATLTISETGGLQTRTLAAPS